MRRRYEEMTSTDLAARTDLAGAIAVVPIAAIEQHGPHLPLGTDALIADHMVETVLPLLPDDLVATFLPVMRVGASAEHGGFAGTIDQGWRQTVEGLIAVGEGLAAAGFQRLVIVSSHGGNTPAMETAALELRRSHGLLVATCNWMRFGTPSGLLPEAELAHGIHGGAVETALMLHFRPDLVRGEALADFPSLQSELEQSATKLRAHGRLGFGWMAGDLNPAGVVGDTRLATAEMGRTIAEHQAKGFAELLVDVARFDLRRLA
ncbi:creatininase family protein [Aureimonas glaciei]|uniref:Creatininase n=1 Tax=Aureimonas glaciei TaxID=1776957 RepID=A0A916Y2K6_9HYPH|nr:creatininase family protein [Aureimonas glaciei]GGD26546.1 creatininase [Aureimonas glaciei]